MVGAANSTRIRGWSRLNLSITIINEMLMNQSSDFITVWNSGVSSLSITEDIL